MNQQEKYENLTEDEILQQVTVECLKLIRDKNPLFMMLDDYIVETLYANELIDTTEEDPEDYQQWCETTWITDKGLQEIEKLDLFKEE